MISRSIVALTLALPAAAAAAQTPAPQPATPQATTPPAKAGLSLAEFQARREKAVMKADSDGDGRISQTEWSTFQAKRGAKTDPAKSFARLDGNKDGFIDKAELDAFFAKRFARLDADKDGALAREELPGHKSAAKPAQ